MRRSVPLAPFTALDDIFVHSVMSPDIVSCPHDMELHEVASLMAREGTHSIVVEPSKQDPESGWTVISDRDVVKAHFKPHAPAWSISSPPTLTVGKDAKIMRAVRLMSELETAHLIVVDSDHKPVGIVSTLDVVDVMRELSERASEAD